MRRESSLGFTAHLEEMADKRIKRPERLGDISEEQAKPDLLNVRV